MRWIRKIAAILVMILAAVGFVLCVGLLIGSWAVNEPATQAATGTLDMVEQYLNLADEATTRTNETIGYASQELEAVEQIISSMSEEDKQRVSDRVRETLINELGPYVNGIDATVYAISAGVQTVDRTLATMNSLPGVTVPQIGDDLAVAVEQLDAVNAGIDDMRSAVSEADFDGTRVQNAAAGASDSLRSLESVLTTWQSRIDATENATSRVKANVPRWIDLSSTAITLLAVLFGAGQVALFMAGWRWFKDE